MVFRILDNQYGNGKFTVRFSRNKIDWEIYITKIGYRDPPAPSTRKKSPIGRSGHPTNWSTNDLLTVLTCDQVSSKALTKWPPTLIYDSLGLPTKSSGIIGSGFLELRDDPMT